MHPYLQLIRFDKPVGTWLLMLPCWWGVLAYSQNIPYIMLGLFALGAWAMRSAGCILNDMADRDIDAKVARTASRPLASGVVSVKEASALLAILLTIACIVAVILGWKIVVLGIAWLPLVVAYPYMKRITFWPQAFLGLTFGAGPLFGMVAASGSVSATGCWLYAASFFWTIGYDTIYACQDMKDDARIGVKSTARLFGRHIRAWVSLFYGFSAVCLLTASGLYGFSPFIWLAVVHMIVQLYYFIPEDPARCATLFKSNVWLGLIVCVAFATGFGK